MLVNYWLCILVASFRHVALVMHFLNLCKVLSFLSLGSLCRSDVLFLELLRTQDKLTLRVSTAWLHLCRGFEQLRSLRVAQAYSVDWPWNQAVWTHSFLLCRSWNIIFRNRFWRLFYWFSRLDGAMTLYNFAKLLSTLAHLDLANLPFLSKLYCWCLD